MATHKKWPFLQKTKKKMRKILQYMAAFSLLCLLSIAAKAGGTPKNVALQSTLSASFTSSYSNLAAVNDGKAYRPAKATAAQYYDNWHGAEYYGETNWIECTFPFLVNVVSSAVYWYFNDSISLPSSAHCEYWDIEKGEWVASASVDTLANRYNSAPINQQTNKIRLYLTGKTATGVVEWQVWGIQVCDTNITITPYVKVDNGEYSATNCINVVKGGTVTLLADAKTNSYEDKSWTWTGPNGFTAEGQTLVLTNVADTMTGTYKVTYANVCEDLFSQSFVVNVSSLSKGALYDWPAYQHSICYDYRDEFPAIQAPTKVLDDDPHVVGVKTKGWWCFRWGPRRRSEVTDVAIDNLLDRMNHDFAYFRDVMGWPPDYRAQQGYYCTVDLFGSGLNDGADTTALGGWQSANYYNGHSWPMVLASYYPIACFDPNNKLDGKDYQTGAMVHEGIHAVLASLQGCKDAGWFQEGGNCWLQQEFAAETTNSYDGLGWLGTGSFMAPFMPIECYSGWLQDDTFGGPSAEGVNKFNDEGKQLCTWRNLLGGVQYSTAFPTCLGVIMGDKAIPWIWRYCSGRVLEGIAAKLGEKETRHLIQEYRAKQATFDLGKWSSACRKLTDVGFNADIKSEYTPYWKVAKVWKGSPYAITTKDSEGWLTPEYRTTPGWSGANLIPLYAQGDTCSVFFQPLGANMSCQLVYRSKSGYAYYSEPVACGECTLIMPEEPANGIVIAVICNTDYIYYGEVTRTTHYDYRLKMGQNITGTAATNIAWYNKWTLKNEKNPYITNVQEIEGTSSQELSFKVSPTVVKAGGNIYVDYEGILPQGGAKATLYTASGKVCRSYAIDGRGNITLPENAGKGLYLLKFATNKNIKTVKLIFE